MVDGAAHCSPEGEALRRSKALLDCYCDPSKPWPWLQPTIPDIPDEMKDFLNAVADDRRDISMPDWPTGFEKDNE